MENDDLAIYLNDHMAGSVGALELIDRLIKNYDGQPLAQFCQTLRNDIAADQEQLSEMMKALAVKESSIRQAGAWLSEKLSRFKLRLEGENPGKIGMVLALEGLVLGIKGKEGLWRALAAVQASWPPLQRFDFALLEQRAIEQGARVDEQRVPAARQAFARPEVR